MYSSRATAGLSSYSPNQNWEAQVERNGEPRIRGGTNGIIPAPEIGEVDFKPIAVCGRTLYLSSRYQTQVRGRGADGRPQYDAPLIEKVYTVTIKDANGNVLANQVAWDQVDGVMQRLYSQYNR